MTTSGSTRCGPRRPTVPKAAGLIPTEMISDVALIGPPGRIREHVSRWEQTVVTTLLVQSVPFGRQDVVGLRAVAEALR